MKFKVMIKPALLLSVVLSVFSCGNGQSGKGNENTDNVDSVATENKTIDTMKLFSKENLGSEPVFIIHTTAGDIKVMLYSSTPKHRDNFIKLASEKYFDGMLFHRVIEGFIIQTGDPYTKDPEATPEEYGTGGPGYNVRAEIVKGLTHKYGALAAARRGDSVNPEKESSGSQFYIVADARNCSHLDGEYTIFGETIEGFETIEKISHAPTDRYDLPLEEIRIISVLPEDMQK